MSVLIDLARRIELALSADRALDVDIVFAIHPEIGAYQPHCSGEEPIFWNEPYRKRPCPKFTGSIDEALTLVDPDHRWSLGVKDGCALYSAKIWSNDGHSVTANGCHKPQLALAGAALRMRALLLPNGE